MILAYIGIEYKGITIGTIYTTADGEENIKFCAEVWYYKAFNTIVATQNLDGIIPTLPDDPNYDDYLSHLNYLIESYWRAMLEKKKILINERIYDLEKDFQ